MRKSTRLLCLFATIACVMIASAPLASAGNHDNFSDLYDSTIGQFERVFPLGEMLYMFLLIVFSVGVYMKTDSVGAVLALLAIGGVLLATGVGDIGRLVFGFGMVIMMTFLIYMVYRRR